jgi:hypothetical protein
MGAREYDFRLGRWLSADTIVPDPANPQSLNRFSYVLGNPLRYTDPTGHLTHEQIAQLMDFEDEEALLESEVWNYWQQNDPMWIDVLYALEAGCILTADWVDGSLHFTDENGDGIIQITAYGTNLNNLWNWQGKGMYHIDHPERNPREDAQFMDALFDRYCEWNAGAFWSSYKQPMLSYGKGSGYLEIAGSYGDIPINRYLDVQVSGVFEAQGWVNGATLDYAVDGILTLGGVGLFFTPSGGMTQVVGGVATVFGLGKLTFDTVISVGVNIDDPMFIYRTGAFLPH